MNQTERNKFFEDHVLESYTESELLTQYIYMNNGRAMSKTQCGTELVDGGCFCIYYAEMDDLRKETPSCIDGRLTAENAWEVYKHQVTKAVVRILNRQVIKPSEIYEIAKATMFEGFIDHHASDLYLKKTPVSDCILSFVQEKVLTTTFSASDGSGIWYDIPFCYIPFFSERSSHNV